MLVIFDMLISLFERAYLVAWKPSMGERRTRRWNSWDDYIREWCRRQDFHNALPQLLSGEDPQFQDYLRRIAAEERGAIDSPPFVTLKGAHTMAEAVVIVSAARTPMGAFQGDFSTLSAHDLGGAAIRAAVERAGIPADAVGEVLFGNCLMAGQGQAPARQAAFKGGLPKSAGAVTLSKMCGSGMKAAMFAHDMLLAGSHEVMVAGGMESMTNAPYLLLKGRGGYRMGHDKVYDHMMLDGLEDAYEAGRAMGTFGEDCAAKYKFSREAQDAFATASVNARQEGHRVGRVRQGDHPGHGQDPRRRVGDLGGRGPGQGQARQDRDAQAGVQEGRHHHRRLLVEHQRRRRGAGDDGREHRQAPGLQAAGAHRRPCDARAGAELVHHRAGRRHAEAAGQDRLEGRRTSTSGK